MRGEHIDIDCVDPGLVRRVLGDIEPLLEARPRVCAGIMGESGSGKTVLAHALGRAAEQTGRRAVIIQLDDYFRLPPRDNDARRRQDIAWVGPGEVDLERLDSDLARIAQGAWSIDKPLVDFAQNTIGSETLALADRCLAIVEGTYVGMLRHVDVRIFIDRTYRDTRDARLARGREAQSTWLESVLAIEHDHIRPCRERADMVIDREYRLREDPAT